MGVVLFTAGMQAQQSGWFMTFKPGVRAKAPAGRSGVVKARPQASIGPDANGLYCTSPMENGVGIHDLGGIPAGVHVVVTVESYSDGFDPVAAVVVPQIGQKASNTIKLTNFYDNDSGGEGDSRIDFVAPQEGNYILVVGDLTDANVGCYRYQVLIG